MTKNRILVEPLEMTEEGKSIIIIPENIKDKKRSTTGKVVEVGPFVDVILRGDKILYAEYGFEPIEIEGKKYQIGTEENVFAVIENEATI